MDSEMTDFCFSCWNRAHVSRPVREPRISPIVGPEFLRFQLFLCSYFGLDFFTQNRNFRGKLTQNGPKVTSFGSCFLEAVRKWKSVFGLRRRVRIAYEPILWSAQGDPKIEEKRDTFQNHCFYRKNTKMYENRAPKGLQMGEGISRESHFDGSWGTFGAPTRFLH